MQPRLYYEDAYRTHFSARVTNKGEENGVPFVALNQTAFYPTGGGQPHDTGTLNDIPVINVEETDEGEIRHYLEQPLETDEVVGIVDWDRRFDLMQQHSAQHLITAFFQDYYGFETDSFHLGEEIVTIDLNTPELSKEVIQRVEDQANTAIMRNIPIEARWMKQEQLERYPLRKPIEHDGPIRLVIIPEVDYNGCGGTHPRSTGEVHMVKIIGTERVKKKTRVSFVAGERARRYFDQQNCRVRTYARQLKTSEDRIEGKIERLLEEKKQLAEEVRAYKTYYFEKEAERLAAEAKDHIIAQSFTNETIQELQTFANIIVERFPQMIVLFTTQNDDIVQLVAARDKKGTLNLRDVAKEIFAYFGGRGGGSPHFIQGGGETEKKATDVLEKLSTIVQNAND